MRIGEQQKKILLAMLPRHYKVQQIPEEKRRWHSGCMKTRDIIKILYPHKMTRRTRGRYYPNSTTASSVGNSMGTLVKSGLVEKPPRRDGYLIPGWRLTDEGVKKAKEIIEEINKMISIVNEYNPLIARIKDLS